MIDQSLARWAQDEPRVYTLKSGTTVLATIKEANYRFFVWSLADNSAGGWKETKYAAQRAVRKKLGGLGTARRALREGQGSVRSN